MRIIQFLKDYDLKQMLTGDYVAGDSVRAVYYITTDNTKERLRYHLIKNKVISKNGYYMLKYYTHNVWVYKEGINLYLTSYAEVISRNISSNVSDDYLTGRSYKFFD